jgi:arylsulfatase A
MFSKILFAAVVVAYLSSHLLAGMVWAQPDHPIRPNIIVILADDLGYGDLSCYGATTFETLQIDRVAREGIRFTSGYSSASTCTPTRYSLLTGQYAFRNPGTSIAPPNSPAIIQPGTETLPAILQRAGYRTAVIGKWHLGLGGPKGPAWNGDLTPGPIEIGFDSCFILPTTNDRVPQVYVQDHRVADLDPSDPLWVGMKKPSEDHPTGLTHRNTLKLDWDSGHNGTIHNGISRIGFYTGGQAARFRDEDLADEWVERAEAWIEQNRQRPFFLYFASHDLHVPRMPNVRFQGRTPHGFRGDAILELDWCVGELLRTLERLELAANTLIVFCSDNGPVLNDGYKDEAVERLGTHRPAGPYSGGKYSVLEGGTRTPFIAWWPGKIKPGVSDQIVCTVDLAASLSALVGEPIRDGGCSDSQNVLLALLGDSSARGRESLVQQDNSGRSLGFRKGNWKLVRTPRQDHPQPDDSDWRKTRPRNPTW